MRTATPEEQALWPSPNFDNPEQLHGPIIGVTVTTFIVTVLFLTGRLVGKKLLRQNLEVDDYLMLAAMTVTVPMSIFPLVCLNFGLGLHIWDQRPEWHASYAKLGFASDILFPIACSLTKMSQCLSYLRLFPGRSNEIFCNIMIIFIATYTIACIFVSLLQCHPIRAYWSPVTGLECMNMHAMLATIAALNSLSDLLIYLRPTKPLLVLRMPLKQRWGLVLLSIVSLLPCIAGLLRLYFLEALWNSVDELWNASILWALMMVEMNLGIVCCCVYGVQPVLALVCPRLFAHSYSSQDSSPPQMRRQTSDYFENYAAYPLSDLSGRPQDAKLGVTDTFAALWTPEGTGSSFAIASSSKRDPGVRLVPGVITVNKEFTVKEEVTPYHSPISEFSGKLHFISHVGSMEDVCLQD